MKHGLLIYDPADIPRNQWFIQQMRNFAEPEGLSLRLCSADALPPECPDFAVNRSRRGAISAQYEAQGIRVFNSAAVTEITNDKYRTHLFLREHRIPTADSLLVSPGDMPDFPLPAVAKPLDGHGGNGVEWLDSAADLARVLAGKPRPFLLQAPMVTGWDMRVYVLGGQVYAAMLRQSDGDFRSNFSLGGTAEPVTPDAEIRALVQRVQDVLPLDFAGVDILRRPGGGYVIGEIEDAVGCRMLYAHTARDPARDLVRYIAQMV